MDGWPGWRVLGPVVALGLVLATSGASCPMESITRGIYPCELPPNAELADYVAVVNHNSNGVHSLLSEKVEISARMPGQMIPTLKAKLAFEKPRRFRLVANGPVGDEVDFGSNDEEFWFWVRRNEPPAVYFCRHEDYEQNRVRMAMPIDPQWVMEALGVLALDAGAGYEGPARTPNGLVAIRSTSYTPQGRPVQRVILLDACNGWIREQHLLDEQGRLVARAVLSGQRRDPAYGVVLPGRIDLSWPATGLSLEIEMRDLRINEALAGRPGLWQRNYQAGVPEIDMRNPMPGGGRPGRPGAVSSLGYPEGRR